MTDDEKLSCDENKVGLAKENYNFVTSLWHLIHIADRKWDGNIFDSLKSFVIHCKNCYENLRKQFIQYFCICV